MFHTMFQSMLFSILRFTRWLKENKFYFLSLSSSDWYKNNTDQQKLFKLGATRPKKGFRSLLGRSHFPFISLIPTHVFPLLPLSTLTSPTITSLPRTIDWNYKGFWTGVGNPKNDMRPRWICQLNAFFNAHFKYHIFFAIATIVLEIHLKN